MTITIESLTIYPVKSLRGIHVKDWMIDRRGLHADRQWMVVMPNGRFVSQRQLPLMALIDVELSDTTLNLAMAGKGSISLPINTSLHSPSFKATVWRDSVDVQEASEAASRWLTHTLNARQPLRLVQTARDAHRPQSQLERFGTQNHTRFADAAPLLIANQASLSSLNDALIEQSLPTVDMRRFRPNIVISGMAAFTEHLPNWQNLQHPNFSLSLIDHCERCIITTIDPETAQKHPDKEPYETLKRLNPMPESKAPAFGVNTVFNSDTVNRIRIGDTLRSV